VNYRHAFHAGNHADVLKHTVLLALVDALQRKDGACFFLDSHAGPGRYALDDARAARTGEAREGVARLSREDGLEAPALRRYLEAIRRHNPDGGLHVYPGSPRLLADALRAQDRLACCELHPEEAASLRQLLRGDPRIGVHQRDGYEALSALLPPQEKRGLALIDPPYEAQFDEYDRIFPALRNALSRWPKAVYALWYPIKQGRALHPMLRRAATLPVERLLRVELLVRADDSPLRMNGSGLLILNPPWQIEQALQPVLPILRDRLGEAGATCRLDWLRGG